MSTGSCCSKKGCHKNIENFNVEVGVESTCVKAPTSKEKKCCTSLSVNSDTNEDEIASVHVPKCCESKQSEVCCDKKMTFSNDFIAPTGAFAGKDTKSDKHSSLAYIPGTQETCSESKHGCSKNDVKTHDHNHNHGSATSSCTGSTNQTQNNTITGCCAKKDAKTHPNHGIYSSSCNGSTSNTSTGCCAKKHVKTHHDHGIHTSSCAGSTNQTTSNIGPGCCAKKEVKTHDHGHNHNHGSHTNSSNDSTKQAANSITTTTHHHGHDHSHENRPFNSTKLISHQFKSGNTHDEDRDHDSENNSKARAKNCVALLHENGTDVIVFDAAGTGKVFNTKTVNETASTKSSSSTVRTDQLCFSSHGSDELINLTPCFDENGIHGVRSDLCVCGVDMPHLHAHLKNPNTCSLKHGSALQILDFNVLVSQTLFPVPSVDDGTELDTKTGITSLREKNSLSLSLQIPVTLSMPSDCNSKMVADALHEKHRKLDCGPICEDSCPIQKNKNETIRLSYTVQHGDHMDHLVHNRNTGQLHLEHACNYCGLNDIHGVFVALGERLSSVDSHKLVRMQFYAVERTKPFRIVEFLQSLVSLNSDRVIAAENVVESLSPGRSMIRKNSSFASLTKASKASVIANVPVVVRSTIKCSGICCSSEIPIIMKILQSVDGVKNVMVNAPLKRVSVDHDPAIISAFQIGDVLTKQNMKSSVEKDGYAQSFLRSSAQDTNTTTISTSSGVDGRSQFSVQNVCCASEIPAILKIVQPIPGVKAVTVNTTTKVVYADHNVNVVSAATISLALTKGGFGSEIRLDAADVIARRLKHSQSDPFLVQSVFAFEFTIGTYVNQTSQLHDVRTMLEQLVHNDRLVSFHVEDATKTEQLQSLTIVHNPFITTAQTIADYVNDTMFANDHVDLVVDGADPMYWKFPIDPIHDDNHGQGSDDNLTEAREGRNNFVYPRPAVILSGIFWIVSMVSLAGPKVENLKYVALLSVAFGIPLIAKKAFTTLCRYQFDTNCLMLFATIGALALQDYPEAAAVTFLFALSEWLEVRATTRARKALAGIVQLLPDTANIVHPFTKELIVIPAIAVPLHAMVTVRSGDKIPCDGIVIEGETTVDESSLTGESRPVQKRRDDYVSGGTVNSGKSPILVKTTSTSEDSAVARLIRLVEEAQANRSETEKLVDEFAKIYTPIVVLTAVLMCSIPWAFGPTIGREWTSNGLILIVVACPCALIISTPVAYVAGLAAAAQRGILIKGGAYLEALAQVKYICFDKTGTLTNGKFSVLHLEVLTDTLTRSEVLEFLSIMEEKASHPVAQAMLNLAITEGVAIPTTMTLEGHTILNGEGVHGIVNGLEVYVGNERLFERLGMLQDVHSIAIDSVNDWKTKGGTVGFVSVLGHGVVCSYCVADGVRLESADVVRSLQKRNIVVTMLTGDNHEAAVTIGKQVGLELWNIKSKLLPEEKLDYVKSLVKTNVHETDTNQHSDTHDVEEGTLTDRGNGNRACRSVLFNLFGTKKKLVMMCGDGVNDAPALAAADIGVAMGSGAALAMETADVTLLDSNPEKIEFAIQLGQRVTRKIIENVIFSLVVKFIVLGFAFGGMAHLWAAIASDVGAMLVVTLNAMTILPKNQQHQQQEQ